MLHSACAIIPNPTREALQGGKFEAIPGSAQFKLRMPEAIAGFLQFTLRALDIWSQRWQILLTSARVHGGRGGRA
eukprot:4275528-Alexandrium_andersonii.AAC.1